MRLSFVPGILEGCSKQCGYAVTCERMCTIYLYIVSWKVAQEQCEMRLLVKECALFISILYPGGLPQNSVKMRFLVKECALLICTMYPGGLLKHSAVRQVLVKSVHLLLAHLSQRLIGELIGYPWSGVRVRRCCPSIHNLKRLLH